jgi:hypothetical protein
LAAQAGQRELAGMVSDLHKFMANIQTMMPMEALRFEMNGQMAIADFVRSNPESVISILPGLLQMAQVMTAPGGAQLPMVNFGSFG